MKKAISLILLGAMIASLAACGGEAAETDTTDTGATVDTSEVTTADPNADSLPDGLDFNGEVINILFPESHGGSADQIDFVEEDDGEVVSSALYQRQSAVEERLNVELVTHKNYKVSAWVDPYRNSVLAGDHSFDLVYGPQSVSAPLVLENLYLDLSDAKYIDYSKPWWNNAFMDECTIGGKRYLLAGDISLSMLSYMSCMYYNKNRFEVISGEAPDSLYNVVLDGKWTIDKLAEYCRKSYQDLNGDSTFDDNDSYGMGAVTASTVDHLTFDSGVRLTERNAKGIPEFVIGNERTIDYAEQLYSLFYENEGVRVYPAVQDTLRILLPNKLINGEVTFMCGYFYSADLLRDMTSDYGIIPYPKLDESIENYGALVHNSAQLVSVPIDCEKIEAVCATIEAIAAENYRTVFPAYYEVALKTKYTRDDLSGQIIDLIHDAGTTDFAYIYNNSIGNAGLIMRKLMEGKTSDLASQWASISTAAENGLTDLIAKYSEND